MAEEQFHVGFQVHAFMTVVRIPEQDRQLAEADFTLAITNIQIAAQYRRRERILHRYKAAVEQLHETLDNICQQES